MASPSNPPLVAAPAPTDVQVSIIIPTLNEVRHLAATLAAALGQHDAPPFEVIVVDGGSSDGTATLPPPPVRIVNSPAGRAVQQNIGARHARGDILLFLHADTRLPANALRGVMDALQATSVAGGAFRLRIAARGWAYRMIERGANVRSRLLRLPYGDQALFIRRETFNRLGGFADSPFMEDVDLVIRMRRLGRVRLMPGFVETSPRRWQVNGPLRMLGLNALALLLFRAKVPPEQIQRIYRTLQKRRPIEPSP